MTDSDVASSVYTINISPQNISIDLGGGVMLEMVKIPAGTFQMGSPVGELDRNGSEALRTVTITKDFFVGKYEVTQGQWKAIMSGANPSYFKTGDNYPVEQVSWNDITMNFLPVINAKGLNIGTFRLPTEAEWEYACRAGASTRFYWGDDLSYSLIGIYAWANGNSNNFTHPVGQKQPNQFGLYDMSGNVSEWCNDFYEIYGNAAVIDPALNSGLYTTYRGGSFGKTSECRSARRESFYPHRLDSDIGFRLALSTGR